MLASARLATETARIASPVEVRIDFPSFLVISNTPHSSPGTAVKLFSAGPFLLVTSQGVSGFT